MNLDPKTTFVVEKDPRVASALKSTVNYEFKQLKGTSIEVGDIVKVLDKVTGKFNFVNLDFLGHVARGRRQRSRNYLTINFLLMSQ